MSSSMSRLTHQRTHQSDQVVAAPETIHVRLAGADAAIGGDRAIEIRVVATWMRAAVTHRCRTPPSTTVPSASVISSRRRHQAIELREQAAARSRRSSALKPAVVTRCVDERFSFMVLDRQASGMVVDRGALEPQAQRLPVDGGDHTCGHRGIVPQQVCQGPSIERPPAHVERRVELAVPRCEVPLMCTRSSSPGGVNASDNPRSHAAGTARRGTLSRRSSEATVRAAVRRARPAVRRHAAHATACW